MLRLQMKFIKKKHTHSLNGSLVPDAILTLKSFGRTKISFQVRQPGGHLGERSMIKELPLRRQYTISHNIDILRQGKFLPFLFIYG